MDFIANDWLIPPKQLDKNLISMRLCIQPSDICTTKITKAELSSYDYQVWVQIIFMFYPLLFTNFKNKN